MSNAISHTPQEMMVIAASRALKSHDVCFVGIGFPSEASNLARLTHAPGLTMIYESGTIGAKPSVLPLSIADRELCATALTTVPNVEIFRYWLQGGRITVGLLGGAQVDRFGNINSTVIGPYAKPKLRLPGSGGATEIAASSAEIHILMQHTKRNLVSKIDFLTSLGQGRTGAERESLGAKTKGPTHLFTDLCVMRRDAATREFVVASIHPGVSREQVRDNTGWDLVFTASVEQTPAPAPLELARLRALHERTSRTYGLTSGS